MTGYRGSPVPVHEIHRCPERRVLDASLEGALNGGHMVR